jgi:mycothiol synthase
VVSISVIDPATATDTELAAYHDLFAGNALEAMPDEEPEPLAHYVNQLRVGPPARHLRGWLKWDDGGTRLLGASMLMFWVEETNQDMGTFWVDVRPEARRQGIGRELLRPLIAVARDNGRIKLDAATTPRIPAGAAFLESLGARRAFVGRRNRLRIADLDLDLLHDWVDRAKERAAEYRLEGWDGGCPDERVEAFVAAEAIMNTAPREDFDVEDSVFTVDLRRQREQALAERDEDIWVLTAVHEPTGEIAGYTEIELPSTWPTHAQQGDTGVDPSHRNKGLGRWLKAAMLLRLIDERPEVREVWTFNAGSNAPMLNINDTLGFRCAAESPTYQIDLDALAAAVAD